MAVAAGVCVLVLTPGRLHPLALAGVILWLAYFQYCWTTIFHEDVHLTLYRARWHNHLNGSIVGTLLLVPFSVYRQVHSRHHARMNTPEDWELWPYDDPQKSLAFRRVFAVLDVLLGAWVDPWIYGRIYWVRHSPLREPGLRRRIAFEYALIVVFWGGLLTLVATFGWWREFLLAYVIPAWLTGVFQTLRKFVDHLGLPAGDAMGGCRTVLSGSLAGRLVDWTSLDISAHGLHHKFPQMPHENLARALPHTAPEVTAPVFSSHLAAFRDMLRSLPRPGVGVNAPRADSAGSHPAPAAKPAEG